MPSDWSGPALFALALGLVAPLMAAAFLLALRIRNFSIVDIASGAFTPTVLLYATLAGGYAPRRALIAAMVTAWSLRLAGHLYARVASLHPEEEGRYVELRRQWATRLHGRFLVFFQAQGTLAVLLSLPFLFACLDRRPALGGLKPPQPPCSWSPSPGRRLPIANSPPSRPIRAAAAARAVPGSGATRGTRTTSSSG